MEQALLSRSGHQHAAVGVRYVLTHVDSALSCEQASQYGRGILARRRLRLGLRLGLGLVVSPSRYPRAACLREVASRDVFYAGEQNVGQ
eukprot:2568892-Alexandrium_andersonii.AAC.1